jgi:shikimate dehydrogenase
VTPPVSSRTRLIALLGDPIGHSLSPVFQNAAIRHLGLDAVYVALRCGAAELPGLVRGIARAGGGGNVTVPHKEIAASAVDVASEAVDQTGACNTFWLEGERIHGDNTDVLGFASAARSLVGRDLSGCRTLLIGAGGAARGAAYALRLEGADEVIVYNRSEATARELVDRFSGSGTRYSSCVSPTQLRGQHFDLVVNATSLGLREADPLPLPSDSGVTFGAALDLVYRPDRTLWVRSLRQAGIPAEDGLEMLLQQGAQAFARWFSTDPPIVTMRAALPPR